jgi:hypothetical protein
MDKLIDSSPITLRWLKKIRSEIEGKAPSLRYKEAVYYAQFWSPEKNKNIVQIRPQRKKIRVFLRLDPSCDPQLQPTPSTLGYAKSYPSVFLIGDESVIGKAIELIISSYENTHRR